MELAWVVSAALLLDAVLGEPARFHPLVGFGRLVNVTEKLLYRDSILAGALALLLLLLPLILLSLQVDLLPSAWATAIDVLVLYFAIGWKSLILHARRVRDALASGDLSAAQKATSMMVSRDTSELDNEGAVAATIESVLENGNDAIFGAVFWFVIAGLPGVVLYRSSNTLDAMWGYRNTTYNRFGRAAARLDDVLNFVPARLTALSYALVGRTRSALRCWQQQGGIWKSPNAGPVMASGAGSLGILLGGNAIYGGVTQQRPTLGLGRRATVHDIDKACGLIRDSLILWIVLLWLGGWIVT